MESGHRKEPRRLCSPHPASLYPLHIQPREQEARRGRAPKPCSPVVTSFLALDTIAPVYRYDGAPLPRENSFILLGGITQSQGAGHAGGGIPVG